MIATTISNSISEKPLSFNLVIWTTYKRKGMEFGPIPSLFELQSVLVSECGHASAAAISASRNWRGTGRTSHHTVFGDAEVAGT